MYLQEKRTCYVVNFAIPKDNRVKKKKNRRKWKEKQIIRSCQNQKYLWNIKVAVIPVVVGTLGTVPKGLEKRLEEVKIKELRPYRPQHG